MRFAIDVAPVGELADPHVLVRLAVAAEAAGWDGFSTWDGFGVWMDTPESDPFVDLAAVASATSRLTLILSVLALPRRRPQLVAQAVASLDRWSGGRLILGVGSGGDPGDFDQFGESGTGAERAALLDEGLTLVDALLRGEPVDHDGAAYVAHVKAGFGLAPAQDPRPPVWIGGMKAGALRRAARWDGWIGVGTSEDGRSMAYSPADVVDAVRRIDAERAAIDRADAPFEVGLYGLTDAGDRELAAAYGAAGVTWWVESLSPTRGTNDELLARVEAGPPR